MIMVYCGKASLGCSSCRKRRIKVCSVEEPLWLANPIPRPNLSSLANLLTVPTNPVTLSPSCHRPRGAGTLGRSTRCWSPQFGATRPVDMLLASADFEISGLASLQRQALVL